MQIVDPSGNLGTQPPRPAVVRESAAPGVSSPLWLYVTVLVLLPLLTHAPFLLGIWTIDPLPYEASAYEFAAPWKGGLPFLDPNTGWQAQALGKLAADLWLSGQVPWWNPYNGVGLPLAAEAQPGALFLPFILLYHFRLGIVWVAVLLQIIAGLSTFALLRKIRLTVLAAFAGAILYEFNGTFAWHGAPIIMPVAFLPLLLLAIEYWYGRVDKNQPGGGWVWIAPVLAWSLYAGFPEIAYLDGLLVVIWVLARLTDLERPKWWLYLRGLLFGAGCGLLLSLPLIIPFHEMIGLSFIGGHDGAFAHASLPTTAAAHSLIPWLFGPAYIFPGLDWGSVGGYLPVLQVLLALLGVWLVPRKLSFCLLGWMVLCLAKTFDWRPISDLVNLIPLVKSVAFFRYAPPSWELAGAILCALAVHTLQSGGCWLRIRRRFAVIALTVMAVCAGLLIAIAHLIKDVLLHSPIPWTTVLALVWLVISVGLGFIIFLVAGKRTTLAKCLTGLLMVDALFAFALPLVLSSSPRTPPIGEGIAWLQSHVGLQRFYSMGPIAPNYGAYFKLAQINHNYLPVPNTWGSFIRQRLDPDTDKINFIGLDFPSPPVRKQPISLALRKNLAAYEQIGVRYVVVKPGENPFTDTAKTEITNSGNRPFPLGYGPVVTVNLLLPEQARGGTINGIRVLLGNNSNTADGKLHVQACNVTHVCAQGERPLSESTDGGLFAILFDHPLPVADMPTDPVALTVQIQQEGSTHPVAMWMWPLAQASQGVTVSGVPGQFAGMAPNLEIQYAESGSASKLVYRGRDMDIYELPHPAPYFEADDMRCKLTPVSRLTLDTQCPAVTTLTRKEMNYPGWQARIDGHDAPITTQDGLLQSVRVPAGAHRLVFSYTPSHRLLWLGGFLIGLVILLVNLWREFRMRAADWSTAALRRLYSLACTIRK